MTKVELELLTEIDIVSMFEKGIRGVISQAIQRYESANNKYMPNYNLNAQSTYLMYVDTNNLYGYAISKKLPINNFKWCDYLEMFTSDFMKNYDSESGTGYVLEADIDYPKELHEPIRDLPFLAIKKEKLLTTLENKEKYVVHITALKQALNHGLILKKVHRVISYNQKAWLKKPYIDKNTELRKEAKSDFEKDFFKLMNNVVFAKTIENVRNRRVVKLVVKEERRKKLVSEPFYDSCKQFSDNLMAIEMRKTEVLMDKPIAGGQAISDISKTLMYEFWYDYLKPKYQDNIKLCYMDTDSFILQINADDFFKDINNDIEIWFDTSNYDKNDNRPLKIGLNKKVIGKFKDELGGKILTEFVALSAKTYAYTQLRNEKLEEHKKAKGTKKCVIKKHLNFDLYKKALFNNQKSRCTQQRFKSDYHIIYTQTVHKTALNNRDDKRIQSFDGIHTYPHVIDNELLKELEANIRNKPIPLYC